MISTRERPSNRSPVGIDVTGIRGRRELLLGPVGFALMLFVMSTRSPIGEWGEQNLSMHMMVQHPLNVIPGIILGSVAAPLVATWRSAIASTTNIFGVLLATLVLAVWHLPVTFEAAMHNGSIHGLMHVSIFLLVGVPLGLSFSNLGGSGRLLLFATSVLVSLIGTIIPYSAPDLYPSYPLWQHVQMAWLMMVGMPVAGIGVLVISAFWRPLARLWSQCHMYQYGSVGIALLLVVMLTLEIAGLGHFHMLE